MSQTQSYQRDGEKGVYLILMAVGMLMVLALAGIIVDAAKLYRTRLRMQNAADAGVIAGLSYRVLKGPTTPANDITAEAERIIRANLIGIDRNTAGPDNFTFVYNPAQVSLSVDYTRDINLWILNLIPWGVFSGNAGGQTYQQGVPIRVSAQSEVAVANVALMLDISGSMAIGCGAGRCYQHLGECEDNSFGNKAAYDNCVVKGGSTVCPSGPIGTDCLAGSRIRDLQTAAKVFVNLFQAGRDRISLIAYNTGAGVYTALQNWGPSPNDWNTLVGPGGIIDSLIPHGNTNPSSAMLEAHQSMLNGGVFNLENSFYVLFTDGAPTGGRFIFPPGILDSNTTPSGADDYTHLKLTYYDATSNNSFYSPSSLYPTVLGAQPGTVRSDNFFNIFSATLAGFVAPGCSIAGNSVAGCVPATPPQPCWNDSLNTVGNCFGGGPISYQLPAAAGTFTIQFATVQNDLYRLYYDNSVALADYFRNNRGTVMTIGLGQAPGALFSYPYQTPEDDESRKDIFLARLALDPYAYNGNRSNVPGYINLGNLTSSNFFNGYTAHQTPDPLNPWGLAPNPTDTLNYGKYYPTPNSNELPEIFAQAARRILLRLIQ